MRELFDISPEEARSALDAIPDADLSAPTPVNNLRLEPDFIQYLTTLFRFSGLENFRELQEAWNFTLYPKTSGGRYFTLSIDRHEVAFSQPIRNATEVVHHQIVVDRMVSRDREVKRWLKFHAGRIHWFMPYASHWGNARVVSFQCSFDECASLFEIPSFRRALVAYWYDALLRMQDRGTRSLFARFHNYDATSEIFRHLAEMKAFREFKWRKESED